LRNALTGGDSLPEGGYDNSNTDWSLCLPSVSSSSSSSSSQWTETYDRLKRGQLKTVAQLNGALDQYAYRARRTGHVAAGIGIFINPRKLKLVGLDKITVGGDGSSSSSSDDDVFVFALLGKLQCLRTGSFFFAAVAHLKSGSSVSAGRDRTKQLSALRQKIREKAGSSTVILGMDGNYDLSLAPCYEGDTEGDPGSEWRKLQVEDGFSNWTTAMMQSAKNSTLLPVSVNKMRGPFSSQVHKWGAYQLRNIDYLMIKRGLRFKTIVNAGDIQKYPRSLLEQLTENGSSLAEILALNSAEGGGGGFMNRLMPTAENPSDHCPIVVDLIED